LQAPLQDKPPRHDVDIRFGNGRFDERPATRLFEDRLLVLAAPRYRSERALHEPADLQRAELLRSPLLPWRPWFAAAGLDWPEPARGPSFTDLGILLEAAASGLGVALCTRRLAAHWTAIGAAAAALCAGPGLAKQLLRAGGAAGGGAARRGGGLPGLAECGLQRKRRLLRLSSPTERQPISFMPRSTSSRIRSSARSTPG
jgi:hypothetical protein